MGQQEVPGIAHRGCRRVGTSDNGEDTVCAQVTELGLWTRGCVLIRLLGLVQLNGRKGVGGNKRQLRDIRGLSMVKE